MQRITYDRSKKKEEARKVVQKSPKSAILYGPSTYPVEEEGQLKTDCDINSIIRFSFLASILILSNHCFLFAFCGSCVTATSGLIRTIWKVPAIKLAGTNISLKKEACSLLLLGRWEYGRGHREYKKNRTRAWIFSCKILKTTRIRKECAFHALLKDVGREECSSCINKKVLALGRNPFCRT